MSSADSGMTVLLQRATQGDQSARAELFAQVQDQLHAMAQKKLSGEQAGVTIQATVLVHDAYLQLVGSEQGVDWSDRRHFYVLAAKAMRRILVDHARKRRAAKRGGLDARRASLDAKEVAQRAASGDVVALHDALKRLSEVDPRQADIVEMRYFGGYSVEETADLLEVSPRTVKADFAAAKAWLFRELSKG